MPLATHSTHPVDILEEASQITRFLAETAPGFGEGAGMGLSEQAAMGLYCILIHVDGMIRMAIETS